MLVDLVGVCFEFDVAVFTDNFEVDYNDPLLFFFAELIRAFFTNKMIPYLNYKIKYFYKINMR